VLLGLLVGAVLLAGVREERAPASAGDTPAPMHASVHEVGDARPAGRVVAGS
jgi:hypothetical protein